MKKFNKINKRSFYNDLDAALVFLFAVVMPQILGFIVVWIALGAGVDSQTMDTNLGVVIPLTLASQLVFFGIFMLYSRSKNIKFSVAANIKTKIHVRNIIFSILIGLVCIFGFNYLILFFEQVFSLFGYSVAESVLPLTNFGWYILNVLLVCILPAVCEELIFRGVVLSGLRSKFKTITAVVLSALLFSLLHGNLGQLIYTFILGLILGYITVKSGSIIYAMIIHFVNNFVVITINYISQAAGAVGSGINMPIWLIFIIGLHLALIAVGVICFLNKFWKPEAHPVVKVEKKTDSKIYLIIAGAICVCFIIYDLVLSIAGGA